MDDREFRSRMARAPHAAFLGMKDGIERGFAGFRREWTPKIGSSRLQAASRWIFAAYTKGTKLGDLEGRMHPRKYHESLGALEEGATLTPRRTRSFAIPVGRVRKRGGRGAPKAGYARPSRFVQRFGTRRKLIPSASGDALLEVRRTGRGRAARSEIVGVAFALRRSVRIPRILHFLSTWQTSSARRSFMDRVHKTLNRELSRVFGSGSVREAP